MSNVAAQQKVTKDIYEILKNLKLEPQKPENISITTKGNFHYIPYYPFNFETSYGIYKYALTNLVIHINYNFGTLSEYITKKVGTAKIKDITRKKEITKVETYILTDNIERNDEFLLATRDIEHLVNEILKTGNEIHNFNVYVLTEDERTMLFHKYYEEKNKALDSIN